jgi:hypothetical protein
MPPFTHSIANLSVANFVQSVRITQKTKQKQNLCLHIKRDLETTSLPIRMQKLSPLSKSDAVFSDKNKQRVKLSQTVTELNSST